MNACGGSAIRSDPPPIPVTLTASVQLSATAGPLGGVAVKATGDSQTLRDGTVSGSVRTNVGNFSVNASATVNATIGPTNVASADSVAGTLQVRAGLVGAAVNAGNQGANLVISVGPQIGVTAQIPALTTPVSAGVGTSARIDVAGAVKSAVQTAVQAANLAASVCGQTPGCH